MSRGSGKAVVSHPNYCRGHHAHGVWKQPSQLLQRPPCTWGLGTAMPTAAEATMHMGSGKGVLSVQVAQGGEEVVSESKTEDSG